MLTRVNSICIVIHGHWVFSVITASTTMRKFVLSQVHRIQLFACLAKRVTTYGFGLIASATMMVHIEIRCFYSSHSRPKASAD